MLVRTPAALADLAGRLAATGPAALADLAPEHLLEIWSDTVEEFRDRGSIVRRALDGPLARSCGLSRPGLDAALEVVLAGVRREPAGRLFVAARQRPAERGLVVVVLASNIPALVVQPLLPALALRRPLLVKSSSAEPLFAPAFVAALSRREPRIGEAIAAVTWPGGESELEEGVFAAASRVVAYGGGEAMRGLAARLGDKLVCHGPKLSIAVVDAETCPEDVAAGLAQDVALFDQRGCLSLQAVFTAGDAGALARALGAALADAAQRWPPGRADARLAAEVRQVRAEAEMRGLEMSVLPLAHGSVIVEPSGTLEPSPGLRLVRVYPVDDFRRLPARLAPWKGRLQGAALAGSAAWALEGELAALGVSRCAAPGDLQAADATWWNGGVPPLEVFSEPRAAQ